MEKGQIVALDKTTKLIQKAKFPYKVTFEPTKNEEKVINELKIFGDITKSLSKSHLYEVCLTRESDLDEVIRLVQTTKPEGLTVQPASLEDIFIELTGNAIKLEEEHAL